MTPGPDPESAAGPARAAGHGRRRWWLVIGCAAVGLAGLYLLAMLGAESLLTVRDRIAAADVIVVLGGDGPARAAWAAALWHKRVAPLVLVSGDGDCRSIADAMIAEGVDAAVITLECRSKTTWENAAFSAPVLARLGVRRAVLVTSWFHSRRALASFAAHAPDVRWLSVPAERGEDWLSLAGSPDGLALLKEFPKTLWYWVRHPSLWWPDNPAGSAPARPAGGYGAVA
ncbi:YdcF family protein [Bosea sp. 117]|uniref:YdcF family protein n=1 Tax=Bosea sp. 117 TaxID=1125973 RepID=UPI000689A1A9|nr:YdcF family protein [Bosea sp. 117]